MVSGFLWLRRDEFLCKERSSLRSVQAMLCGRPILLKRTLCDGGQTDKKKKTAFLHWPAVWKKVAGCRESNPQALALNWLHHRTLHVWEWVDELKRNYFRVDLLLQQRFSCENFRVFLSEFKASKGGYFRVCTKFRQFGDISLFSFFQIEVPLNW